MGISGGDRQLHWARRLQAMAQTGLTYCKDPYDIERYEALRGIAYEMLAAHSDAPVERVRDLFAGESGHATPKVDVRAVVFRDDAMLLVRERSDGRWTLPGGWADVGETPAEAVVREVYEESGYRTRAAKLLAVYDRDRHGHPPRPFYVYKLFFRCDLLSDGNTDRPDGAEHGAAPGQPHSAAQGASIGQPHSAAQGASIGQPHSAAQGAELGGAHGMSYAETDGAAFFRENALPELSLDRVTAAQLHRFFEHYRHPDWPTDFD